MPSSVSFRSRTAIALFAPQSAAPPTAGSDPNFGGATMLAYYFQGNMNDADGSGGTDDFGASIGQLCRAVGVDTVLGPVLDAAARTPRWGRGRSVMIRLASPRLPGASFAGCIGPRFER